MYSLSIGVGPAIWALLFHDEKSAKIQEDALQTAMLTQSPVGLKDDFGQRLQVQPASIHGWVFENLDESKMAHCERMLHQARTQGQAQRMAETDPSLRMGMQMRGAPVLSPLGPNGR